MKARETLTSYRLPEVGSLLILLAWMTNALVNRPDEGSHWDEVRDSGSVHVDRDGHVVPARPLSIFYLHSLHLVADATQLPRLSSQRTISRDTIVYLCGSSKARRTTAEVIELFRGTRHNPTVAQPAGDAWGDSDQENIVVGAPHVPNRQQRVTISLVDDVPDVFADELPQRQVIEQRYDSEDEDPEMREGETPLSQRVTNILHTYPLQVFKKVPNQRNGGSWCTLQVAERYDITFDIFCDRNMPRILFTSYVDCGRDRERWDNTVRAWFPKFKERHQSANVQGLKQLGVWQDWRTLLTDLTPKDGDTMVAATRKRINNEWKWLPWMAKNHLWATGTTSSGVKKGDPSTPGGPWIIFNPRFK